MVKLVYEEEEVKCCSGEMVRPSPDGGGRLIEREQEVGSLKMFKAKEGLRQELPKERSPNSTSQPNISFHLRFSKEHHTQALRSEGT